MECALTHFPGVVVVVSHGRLFIDKVATRLFVFEADGKIEVVNGNWTARFTSARQLAKMQWRWVWGSMPDA